MSHVQSHLQNKLLNKRTFAICALLALFTGISYPLKIELAQATTTDLTPSSVGSRDGWSVNTGSKVAAVQTSDGDDTYITATVMGDEQTYTFPGAAAPLGAVVQSVTLTVEARKLGGAFPNFSPKLKLLVADNSDSEVDSIVGHLISNEDYETLNWVMSENPLTSDDWTVSEVNAWPMDFGVFKDGLFGEVRVTRISLSVDYTAHVVPTASFSITKIIDADGDPATIADQTGAGTGWSFDITPGQTSLPTDVQGQTQSLTLNPGIYAVDEASRSGYTLVGATCQGATNNGTSTGTGIIGLEVGANETVVCTFYNATQPEPTTTPPPPPPSDGGSTTPPPPPPSGGGDSTPPPPPPPPPPPSSGGGGCTNCGGSSGGGGSAAAPTGSGGGSGGSASAVPPPPPPEPAPGLQMPTPQVLGETTAVLPRTGVGTDCIVILATLSIGSAIIHRRKLV